MFATLYRRYDRDPQLLTQAVGLVREALVLKPDLWSCYGTLSKVFQLQGQLKEAEHAAQEYVRRAPETFRSHFDLAYFYHITDRPAAAIAHYESALELRPDDLTAYVNLVVCCDQAQEKDLAKAWAEKAIPHYEKHLRLVPDDDNRCVFYANLLRYSGKTDQAIQALESILSKPDLDGISLYNIACLYCGLGETGLAVTTLRRSVNAGFVSIEMFRTDHDLDPLRELPEFKQLMRQLEQV